VIRKRRLVRAFTSEPIGPGVAGRVLAAANRAPSAGFSQGYTLLVLDEPGQLGPFWERVSDYHGSEDSAGPAFGPVTRAPLVIVPLSCKDIYLDRYARQDRGWTDRDEARWAVPYWDIDTGLRRC
jgi:nitroreductase